MHRTLILAISLLIVFASSVCGCKRVPDRFRSDTGDAGIVLDCLSDNRWTYFSFRDGKVVGQSTFGSDSEDRDWAGRTDWDIAICGEFLRTNSGTSGEGNGGIQKNAITDFNGLTEAPSEGYVIDRDDIVVRR